MSRQFRWASLCPLVAAAARSSEVEPSLFVDSGRLGGSLQDIRDSSEDIHPEHCDKVDDVSHGLEALEVDAVALDEIPGDGEVTSEDTADLEAGETTDAADVAESESVGDVPLPECTKDEDCESSMRTIIGPCEQAYCDPVALQCDARPVEDGTPCASSDQYTAEAHCEEGNACRHRWFVKTRIRAPSTGASLTRDASTSPPRDRATMATRVQC